MKSIEIFNKYMKPFLIKNGFSGKKISSDEICFRHKEFYDATITYIFNPMDWSIGTEISGGNFRTHFKHTLYLTMFLDGPDNFDSINRGAGEWYYASDIELLGIFEKQADLLNEWVFDWMTGKAYENLNLIEIRNKGGRERSQIWENLDENGKKERRKLAHEAGRLWQNTRFYPKKWKLEEE